jgi:hypothetical protein
MRDVVRAVRIAVALRACRLAQTLFGQGPVPFRAVLALRALAGMRDGLLPAWTEPYSMSDVDLDFLAEYLRRLKPSRVLEFGCGESTVRMARVLADVHGDDHVHVFSVDQDPRFADECRCRLAAEGLSAVVVHRALVAQAAPGGETESYDLSGGYLATLLQQDSPDLIAIDGPSGGKFVRFPVLPNVRACLTGETRFLLHDGLRDYELLRVAKAWRGIPGIRVEGVYVHGEGFLTGTLAP